MPGIFELMTIISMMTLGVALFVLWIWTLVDCIRNEPAQGNERIIWVVVIAVTHWIGALIYLIARRPQRKASFGR